MLSDATFRSLLERGDVLVRDGSVYRPLAERDAGRRMYLRLSDGTYTMLDFTADGLDGPEPALRPVSIDIVGSAVDAVTQVDRAVKPASELAKGCVMTWLILMGIITGGSMLLALLFGDEGAPGLIQTYPVLTVVVVVAVIWIVVARRRRR